MGDDLSLDVTGSSGSLFFVTGSSDSVFLDDTGSSAPDDFFATPALAWTPRGTNMHIPLGHNAVQFPWTGTDANATAVLNFVISLFGRFLPGVCFWNVKNTSGRTTGAFLCTYSKVELAVYNGVGDIGRTVLCVRSDCKSLHIDWICVSGNWRFVNSGLGKYIEACLRTVVRNETVVDTLDITETLDAAFANSTEVQLPTFDWPARPCIPPHIAAVISPPTDDVVRKGLESVVAMIQSPFDSVSVTGLQMLCKQLTSTTGVGSQTAVLLTEQETVVDTITRFARGDACTFEQATLGCIILYYIWKAVPSRILDINNLSSMLEPATIAKWNACEQNMHSHYWNVLRTNARNA